MNFSIDVEIAGKESIKIAATSVDEDFFDTCQIEFLEGQNFEKGAVNLKNVFILNEAAVKELEFTPPQSLRRDSSMLKVKPWWTNFIKVLSASILF